MPNQSECPSDHLLEIVNTLGEDAGDGQRMLDRALLDYADDPRLHFLNGSMLAAARNYDAARAAMHHALHLAPGYAIARFQLGFLYFTSGDALSAENVWGPLDSASSDEALALLARGLNHLAKDEFDAAQDILRRGMALNVENPVVNKDMQLILDAIAERGTDQVVQDEPLSSAQFLLQQSIKSQTKH